MAAFLWDVNKKINQRSQSWALISLSECLHKWLRSTLPPLSHPTPMQLRLIKRERKQKDETETEVTARTLEPWAWNLQLIVQLGGDSWSSQVTHLARVCISATTTTLSFSQPCSNTMRVACLPRSALFKFVFRKYLRDFFIFNFFFCLFIITFCLFF